MPDWLQTIFSIMGGGGLIGVIITLLRIGKWIAKVDVLQDEVAKLARLVEGSGTQGRQDHNDIYQRINEAKDLANALRNDLGILREGLNGRLRAFERSEDLVSSALSDINVLRAQEAEIRRRLEVIENRLQQFSQDLAEHRARLTNIERHL